MRSDPALPLLEHLRIFHSRDAEETRAFLHAKAYGFSIERRQPGQLDTRINGTYMPGAYLGYVQYGSAAVALSPGQNRTDYWMQLPLRGHLEARVSLGRTAMRCARSIHPKDSCITGLLCYRWRRPTQSAMRCIAPAPR